VGLSPIANSFSPDYKDRAQGELIAHVKIKGAGTLGVNLQKTLVGQCDLVFTNANIQLVGSHSREIVEEIATFLHVPELVESPLSLFQFGAVASDGKINSTQLRAVSDAFVVESSGIITIAPVFMNSSFRNWPLQVSINRSMAQRARLNLASGVDTNQTYVSLGRIGWLTGTLGKAKVKEDTLAIGLLISGEVIGGQAGEILRGVRGILGGGQAPQTQQPSTPATNAPAEAAPSQKKSKANPLQDLFKLIPKK
jgi:hypothetical protein